MHHGTGRLVGGGGGGGGFLLFLGRSYEYLHSKVELHLSVCGSGYSSYAFDVVGRWREKSIARFSDFVFLSCFHFVLFILFFGSFYNRTNTKAIRASVLAL